MDTAFDLMEQARWEQEGVRVAQARFEEAKASANPATLPGAQKLLRDIVPGLIGRIEALEVGPGVTAATLARIRLVDPGRLAVLVAMVGFKAALARRGTASAGTDVAVTIQMELEYTEFTDKARSDDERARAHVGRVLRRYPNMDARTWRALRKNLIEVSARAPSHDQNVLVGVALLSLLAEASGGRVQIKTCQEGDKRISRVVLSDETRQTLDDLDAYAVLCRPSLMPMIIPPRPWGYDDSATECADRDMGWRKKLVGGFLTHARGFFTSSAPRARTTPIEDAVSDADLRAINALGATGWRVNTFVLDVMREAFNRGLAIAGLGSDPKPLPERLAEDAWAALDEEGKKVVRQVRRAARKSQEEAESHARIVRDCLTTAETLRSRPSIWFPYVKDFRGRIYPATNGGLTPQGSDVAKGLLMFASGLPLGPDGLFWLCVRAANCWGHGVDKLTMEERVAWTLNKQPDIAAAADNPLICRWWTEAEEPWSFLATCYELAQALSSSDTGSFVSHLPIPLDGSCNGIQHLAAMGLDPIAAEAVNLTESPGVRDIYQDVADRVVGFVAADNAAREVLTAASAWVGHITRKTVKRAVMTTPYGVTASGIQTQLLNDRLVPPCDDPLEASRYMRDKIIEALDETVRGPREIMSWLRFTASKLARAGLPFEWTTPSGSRVRQGYHQIAQRRIRTLEGTLTLYEENPESGFNIRKQAAGSAPNYVHSFDAAHLALTVNAAHDDGMRSFAMIHDSYGTHAANTTALGAILRDQFIAIYREDWLAKLHQDITREHPHVQICPSPARGVFDLNRVRYAEYFFA